MGAGIQTRVESEENSEREENSGNGLEKPVRGMLLLVAYAVVLIVIVGWGMIQQKQQVKSPEPSPYASPPEPMEPAALAALEAFFEAPDLPTKAALVRDAARVRPMIEDFHRTRNHPFLTLGRVSPGRAATIDAKPMVMFEVEPFSGPRYFVAVVWDGIRFAVDWESLTAYGTMDWIEFIENKPEKAQTMRVFVRKATADDTPPGQMEIATFFTIEHRDHVQPLVAAAEDELAKTLRSLGENLRSPVTLELVWKTPESGGAALPWIKTMVSAGWSP